MDIHVVLILSVLAQLSAAALSIRLIRITSYRMAWGLIATAVSLMAVRRIVTLVLIYLDAPRPVTSVSAECIAFGISVLLAIGLALIAPMFQSVSRAAAEARAVASKLQALTSVSPAGLFQADNQGRCTYVSARWQEIAGMTDEQARGRGWEDAVHSDDRPRVLDAWTRMLRDQTPLRTECRFRRPDGGTTWVLVQAVPDPSIDEGAGGFTGTITDINQRKDAENKLLAAKQDFETMLGVSPAVLYRCGPAPVLATDFISQNVFAQLGYQPQEFLDDPYFWIEHVHPDDRPKVNAVLESLSGATPRNYDYRFRRKDGSYVWLHDEFQPTTDAGHITGLVGSWFDVTAQRAVTEALRRFEELAEATTDLVGIRDRGGRIIYLNRAGRNMLGVPEHEDLGDLNIAHFRHPNTNEAVVVPALEHAARHGSWRGESTLVTRSGVEIPTLQVISAHRSATGKVEYYSTIMRDITDLKETERQLRQSHEELEHRVEERTKELTEVNARMLAEITERQRIESALRESQQRLNHILGSVQLALYMTPADSRTAEWVSEQFERISGFPPERAVSEPDFWIERIHPHDVEHVHETRRRIFEDGSVTSEYRWRCADGAYRWFRDQATLVHDVNGLPKQVVGTWLDITAQKKAEAELRQSQEQMSAILHNSPAVIYLKGADGRYIFVNSHFKSIFHWEDTEILGRTDEELFTPERAEAFRANDRRVLETGTATEFEEIAIQDGKPHTFISLKFPLYDEDGQPRAVCGISTDITYRKEVESAVAAKSAELEKLAQELKTILDRTGDLVYRHNKEGVFDYCSPSVEQITGYTVEEWSRHYTAAMTDAPMNKLVIGYTEETLATGREFPPYLVEIFHKQGHRITLEINERPLWQNGEVVGIIGVGRDVTARIRADAELKRAKEAAEAASQAKSAFLANVSHEIRTPIMAMMGAAELCADKQLHKDQMETYRDTVLRNSQHLLALINDLLDIARLEAGKIDMLRRPSSLVDLLANVRAATASLPQAARIQLSYVVASRVPRQIETDPTRLAQALINLVNNAIKFTDRGSVTVSVSATPDGPEPRLTFSVSDTGRGIPESDRLRIFENFAQADAPTTEAVGGIGLGLPLARAIAEQLDGDLTVESEEGVGSTFRLRVAIGDVATERWIEPSEVDLDEHTPIPSTLKAASLNLSVLLAEDYADTRELIEQSLRRAGASVVAVGNGQEAVEAAAETQFDLILMDVRMPVLDGREAVLQMRRDGCRSPVIALTASTAPEGVGRLIASGFDAVWPKPLTLSDLLERVSEYANKSDDRSNTSGPDGQARTMQIETKLVAIRSRFLGSLQDKVATLRTAAVESNRALLRERLHQLVGSAGLYGLLEISVEAARLLDIARQGGLDGKPGAFDGLAELAERATHGG